MIWGRLYPLTSSSEELIVLQGISHDWEVTTHKNTYFRYVSNNCCQREGQIHDIQAVQKFHGPHGKECDNTQITISSLFINTSKAFGKSIFKR